MSRIGKLRKRAPRVGKPREKGLGQEDWHLNYCHPGHREYPGCCRHLSLLVGKFLLWLGEFSLWLLVFDVASPFFVTYFFLKIFFFIFIILVGSNSLFNFGTVIPVQTG